MKLYNTFLGTILLTALVALSVYDAGGGNMENPIPGHYVLAGIMALSDTGAFNDKDDKATIAENKTNTTELEDEVFYADQWIKSWFVRFDKNDDKFINRDEFVKNIDPFPVQDYHLNVFNKNESNPDGNLNMYEFNNFIDTTNFLTQQSTAEQAAPIPTDTDEVDAIKLFAGVLAISLLMAAFKLV